MADRILIQLDGSTPKFRVSRAGKSVHSTVMDDFVIREDMETLRPFRTGSITLPSTAAVTIETFSPALDYPPMVLLRCDSFHLPGVALEASINPGKTTLQLQGPAGAVVTWYVYLEKIDPLNEK